MTQASPPGPPPVEPIKLSDEMKQAINGAYDNRTPIVVCYVDDDGQPSLSLRGTTQAWSDDQLAVWARRAEGGIAGAIASRPRLTLFYRDPATRTTLQFRGRARVDNDQATRDRVFDNSPANEQAADPERKGVSIIIDLDRVDGRTPAGPVNMRRDA